MRRYANVQIFFYGIKLLKTVLIHTDIRIFNAFVYLNAIFYLIFIPLGGAAGYQLCNKAG
jgi:hypothetical protein